MKYVIATFPRGQFVSGVSNLTTEYPDASKFDSARLTILWGKDFATEHKEKMPERLDVIKFYGTSAEEIIYSIYK